MLVLIRRLCFLPHYPFAEHLDKILPLSLLINTFSHLVTWHKLLQFQWRMLFPGMRYMNLILTYLYICLFKDILKIGFAKNIHDTIKYSMASIQKKTVDEFFWSTSIRNMVSQHLEVTGWPQRLITPAFQQAPGSQMEHETLLGQKFWKQVFV